MAMSKKQTGTINIASAIFSAAIIGVGVWLSTKDENKCWNILPRPVIALGIALLVASLSGIIAGFWRNRFALNLYRISMIFFLVALLGMMSFIVFVARNGSGHRAENGIFLEYSLDSFHGWLREQVQDPYQWARIKTCITSRSTCADLEQVYRMRDAFYNAHITPFQSGCCKPPSSCNYAFASPTYWISAGYSGTNRDCLTWSNNQTELCYSCDSCKAGFLAGLKSNWLIADAVLLVSFAVLLPAYIASIRAFKKST